ncbi:Hypothetical protein PBC10988_1780 [Planctomycetales bacterium 10988]|nr:Hypothetical protein PBC10988_1780 [Planctomycetales bacterium 10988]
MFVTKSRLRHSLILFVSFSLLMHSSLDAEEQNSESLTDASSAIEMKQSIKYAHLLSRVKWKPVAQGMPRRRGAFEPGVEVTGVPYSSVKSVGRYIGFDIYLKTFLAAVENPQSVVYTENLRGEVPNAECYYGTVCSGYTSYALQCGIWYLSRVHTPDYREGIHLVEPQSAQSAQPGDLIFTPPRPGSHIELVTGVTRDKEGKVTHVRVEESRPPTTMNTNRTEAEFNTHLASKNRKLYRITDLDAWRGANRADAFMFPNYEEDSATPVINRVLLLDRGDWVAYRKDQPVKINIMDRDRQEVQQLVVKRGESIVETIEQPGIGMIERNFPAAGNYSAYCILGDGSQSQACEFAVCDLGFQLPEEDIKLGKPWEIELSSDNMQPILLYFRSAKNSYAQNMIFLTEADRRNGKVSIPADLLQDKGKTEVWLIGENQYGRLKERKEFQLR